MRMTDIVVGKVYVRGYFQGRHGTAATNQRVMIDDVGVSLPLRSRADRVRVHNVSWDEDAQKWKYTGLLDEEGKPHCFLLQARELLTIEEVEEQKREAQRQAEIRERRKEALKSWQQKVATELAMRIGAPVASVTVGGMASSVPDPETGEFQITSTGARVDASAIEAMLESDPDPILIEEILTDIEPKAFLRMTMQELAQHIVGGLRREIPPQDDDDV
jgi:hypothetical protein